ncbi:uncharacterized protein LOC117645172 [Thrips palmi]|uniref:Uncharacterized protein LOC117645172 n=1 Tax=Thrips palmi TaxID=161013 RepID=A0A6P8ZMR2_THRPL|nr:uncharacterized protein LOC117645172 [Thrips palmi]
MRAARSAARRERAFSTVRFMLRRLHDSLRHNMNRDVEQVGERLTTFLERLPCRMFADRLEALSRTLDCRAVAARRRNNSRLAIALQKRRCALAANHGLSALYIRALDEVALLMFSVADYPLAEAPWNERLTRLQQQQRLQEEAGPLGDDELRRHREQRAQVVFQLARCCFVQGFLRMAGPKANKQAAKKDHRRDLPEFSLGLRHTSSDLFKQHPAGGGRRSQSVAESASSVEAEEGDDDDKLYQCEWGGDCKWSPSLLGYDLGEVMDDEVLDYCPIELKPTSVEACLKTIMDELGTEDPLNEYRHLLVMERFPDPEDADRTYPLMPPDFDPEKNIMDEQYGMFEQRFLDACHYFVADITGAAFEPEEKPPAAPTDAPAETAAPEPEPEPERLPSVTEEPEAHEEEQPPA